MDTTNDAAERVLIALKRGDLKVEQLTARSLGAFLGKTTSVLYHHWGSLDGFLYAVGQRGFGHLRADLEAAFAAHGQLADVGEAFVRFGLTYPAVYALMFERHYDWDSLRKAGTFDVEQPGLVLWQLMVDQLSKHGFPEPDHDVRLLYAGLHGLVSLAMSGRVNVRATSVTDHAMAIEAARSLAKRLCPTAPNRRPHHDPIK